MTFRSDHIPTVTTERLTLRGAKRGDFDAYADVLGAPRAAYMGGPYDRKDAWRSFACGVAGWTLDGFGAWIVERRDDRTFLGEVGITFPDHFPEPELGWTVTEAAEGLGYAHEAASAARAWYWANTDARTLVSYVDPRNDRSIALALRLGATPDPNGPWPDGESADETTVFRHRRAA